MPQSFLLRGARQLLTLRGPSSPRRGAALQDLGIVEDGSVLIHDGVIASLGPTRRVENLKAARNAVEVPIEGRIITPGFADANLHLSLLRSDDVHRTKRLADFYDDTLTLMKSCLQHGTITADAEVSADGPNFHSDVAVLRKLTKIGSAPIRTARTWRVESRTPDVLPGDGKPTLDTLLRRNLVDSVAFAAGDSGGFDTDTMMAARTAGLPLKLLWLGGSQAAFTDLMRRFHPHSVVLSSFDSFAPEAFGDSAAIAVLAAGKQVFEGGGSAVGRQLVDAGVPVALSSGYHSVTPGNFSMQMSVALAVARLGLTAEEAWSAATINAAYAAGYGDITGSLEVGKQADLLILNVSDYREIPNQFGLNHVAMVFRDGMMVLNRTRWRLPVEGPADRVRS